jgi:hypothetical protein
MNVPLARNGAMVVTEPYPASRVVEATPCPLGQSVRNPTEARLATYSGEVICLGDPPVRAE